MLLFPPCKINLGLFVTGKRPDGYHNLETVFYPVHSVRDALEAVPATGSEGSLTITGLAVAGEKESNLVWKAYQLMRRNYPDQIPPLEWHLHKTIPMGAGLGGGSSDGAYALRMMNAMFPLGLSDETLIAFALALGSDCPFFIRDAPQFGTGRGEILESIQLDMLDYDIRIERPDIHVSTAAAFGLLTPRPAPFNLRTLASLPVEEWRENIGNDFEKPVFALHPQLRGLKEKLYADGAAYAQMSGSGSAVFGIFPKEKP
jgi:4-diphosphocytidyl-2-C-methyl-D-erythritol kinase